jgi:glycosyltransferase involved in cell wall biosynthesis
MPAYNAEKYIADAIDSVIKQTYTNWELVVVDDGSTDKTAAAINDHAIHDDRINYIYQENGGQGKARNKGLSKAQGKYIAFLDADDIWFPEKLQVQLELMSVNTVDLTFSDAYVFDEQPVFEKKIGMTAGYYKGEDAVRKFLYCNYIPILTVLAKKSAIDNAGGFSELRNIHEDYDLWIRLLIAGHSFLGIDAALAHYRVHSASASSGEGKMLFFTINSLQQIKTMYPRYSADINRSLYDLINDQLDKINFSKWNVVRGLLLARNQLANEKISLSFWRFIHAVMGGRIFRILFRGRAKLMNGTVKKNNVSLEKLVF